MDNRKVLFISAANRFSFASGAVARAAFISANMSENMAALFYRNIRKTITKYLEIEAAEFQMRAKCAN